MIQTYDTVYNKNEGKDKGFSNSVGYGVSHKFFCGYGMGIGLNPMHTAALVM